MDNFFIIWECWEPGAAGFGSKHANRCAMLLPCIQTLNLVDNTPSTTKGHSFNDNLPIKITDFHKKKCSIWTRDLLFMQPSFTDAQVAETKPTYRINSVVSVDLETMTKQFCSSPVEPRIARGGWWQWIEVGKNAIITLDQIFWRETWLRWR